MKDRIWRILVLFGSYFTLSLRETLSNLLLNSFVLRGTKEELRSLLRIHKTILHCVDELSIDIEGGIHPKHRLTKYASFFIDRIDPGARVLDVGCGIGFISFVLSSNGSLVTGIDNNYDQIRIANSRYKHNNLSFVFGDVTTALPDEQFDIVVMSNVLEHISDRVKLLKNLNRTFSPKKILIRVPMINRDWLVSLKNELELCYYSDETHFTEYTWQSFKEEIELAGLEIVYYQINWGEIWAEVVSQKGNDGV